MRREVDGEGRVPGRVVGVGVAVERRRKADAGVVHEDVDRSEPRHDLGDDGFDRFGRRDVERPRRHDLGTVRGGDLVGHGLDAVGVAVGHRHLRPLVGEEVRGRPPHARGRPGDEGDTPGDGRERVVSREPVTARGP